MSIRWGTPEKSRLKIRVLKFENVLDKGYSLDRSSKMASKLIQCDHRHLVFTIDEDLRPFFLNDRSLLDCLFQAVRSVILEMFHKLNKKKNFVPGFVCVLHSFGRPLEWNPHIHYDKPDIMTREARYC